MLILTRKPGESLYIGDDIKITVVEVKGHQIRVGIDAPREKRIYREEIYLQIQEENKQALEAAKGSGADELEGLAGAFPKKSKGARPSAFSGLTTSKAGRSRSDGGSDTVSERKKGEGQDE